MSFRQLFPSTVRRCPPAARTKAAVPLVRNRYHLLKRVVDVVLTLSILPLALPLMACGGFLLWLEDPGPIFFVQQRTGRAGRRFRMFKLRTMVTNAEALREQLQAQNECTWPDFKIARDPRVTRVGRVLRKTSLDELPQLFNVLLGQMSLVGPRPTSFDASLYSLKQTERLEAMPGITGLWQIKGRSDLDFDTRTRLDIQYIEGQSLWLDLQILLLTVPVVLKSRGAY